MATIKKITIKGQSYEIKATYDLNGNKIIDTYATKDALTSETNNRINNESSIKADISALQVNKQDKLIVGSGLDITNNVISVLGFHYSKFTFANDSGVLTSVEGECATAFDSATNTINMDTLINIYPFNQIKREEIQLQYADGSNLLNKDRFTTAPNLYYCVSVAEDGQTQTYEFANYKAGDNFKRPYDDDTISRVAIGCYLACEDTTQSSSPVLRSNTATNGGIFKVNMNQATCEQRLPYLNGEKVDMLDSKVWFFFKALMKCFIGYRNGQSKYYGCAGWGTSTWNYESDLNGKVKDAHLYGTWLAGATDSITSDTLTMTGEITSWTEDDITTEIASGKRPFAILGIENPYGLLWQNLGGLYHTDQNLYQYQGTSHKSNSSFDTSDCELIATDLCSSSGWQKTIACASNVCYPISGGGSDNKLVGDYYWYANSNRLFFVGGDWHAGSYAGFSCLAGDNAFGRAHTHIGFRLSLKY